jgi:hypothetical protein
MATTRRHYSGEFKAKAAMAAPGLLFALQK